MNTMRPSEKRIATGWSFAAGTIFGALATFALLASPGIPKSTADASLQSRPIAGRPAGSAGAPASAPAAVSDVESSSPNMQGTVPGHPELILQLD